MVYKMHRSNWGPVVVAFLSGFFLWACAARTVSIPVEEDPFFEVYLEHQKGEDGAPMNMGYQHPAALTPEEIGRLLRSIEVKYEQGLLRRLFLGPRKEVEQIFTEEEIGRMAPGISRALKKATPADRVGFLLRHPRVLLGARLTTGVLYVKDDRFGIIFGNYQYVPPPGGIGEYSDFQSPLETKDVQAFSLVPGPFQEYSEAPSRRLKYRGLLIDYRNLLAAQPEEPGPAPEGTPPPGPTLEEKLRQLKRLHEQELITEEDYQEKKRRLLDQF